VAALQRRLNLLESAALNMANMVGSGPFITIPLILGAMGGPQAMIGWAVGLVLALCDGLVWAELSVAMPSSGGSYLYLKEAFDPRRFGRVMAFLFVWQYLVSGTAEIASGAIGFRLYLGYLGQQLGFGSPWFWTLLPPLVCVASTALLYRRIETVGKLAVVMWAGMMLTIAVIVTLGLRNFNAANLAFPAGAFTPNRAFFSGLGAAMLVAMYDYLGYYDVCYVAEEVKEPRRVIPPAILVSVCVVAAIYFLMNLCMIAVVPWQEAIKSEFLAALFMERVAGRGAAIAVTFMILWTALASVFALILGGSRIVYAAARDGHFFRIFARLHPKGDFPHLALLVIGALSAAASLFTLDQVINVLMTVRIAVQFIGQILALFLLRHVRKSVELPFRMWLYPVPALVALFGWLYIFATAGTKYVLIALGVVAAGLVAGMVFSRVRPAPAGAP
jgi:amino acid transporter